MRGGYQTLCSRVTAIRGSVRDGYQTWHARVAAMRVKAFRGRDSSVVFGHLSCSRPGFES